MIVLVGFMGAGKTTVGRILAAKLGVPFRDTDAGVVATTGMSIAEIFRERGEPAFRELERETIYETLAGDEAVVALGGGALGDPGIVGQLHHAEVVYLEVSYAEATKRVGNDESRPMLLQDPRELYASRLRMYEAVADVTVATDGRDPEEIALELAARFGADIEGGPDSVRVELGERSYDIVIGPGSARRLNDLLPDLPNAEKAFVATHPSLHPYATELLRSIEVAGLEPIVLFTPEGERCKSLDVVADLYEKLAANAAHRHDVMVTFGGGSISDAAGYVASTYARGMPLVEIPTTLLAQVDASIGGKTAVNLDAGKNLVGTIHQPVLVVADQEFLTTCPRDELRAGLGEVIKYGFINEPTLLDHVTQHIDELLEADPHALARVVSRCAAIKAQIVAEDERETGTRALLNYGHTFAHAIEKLHHYADIRHGEAVAVGMMAAAYLAHELGRIGDEVVEIHRNVLEAAGLPVTASLELGELEEAWKLDKKYKRGVRFVLLSALGRAEAGVVAPRGALLKTVERLRS